MIPMILRMDIRGRGGHGFRLFFPVILIWILAACLLIVLLPLMLIAAWATRDRGPGFRLLVVYPLFFTVGFALSGLRIDVAGRKGDTVFLSLD